MGESAKRRAAGKVWIVVMAMLGLAIIALLSNIRGVPIHNQSHLAGGRRITTAARESFHTDNGTYSGSAGSDSFTEGAVATGSPASAQPDFRLSEALPWVVAEQMGPTSLLLTMSCTSGSKATFVYWSVSSGQRYPSGYFDRTQDVGLTLVSTGPDGDYWQIQQENLNGLILISPGVGRGYELIGWWDVPSSTRNQPTLCLGDKKELQFTYDPTNGTVNGGWLVKQ
jgi:hypothetical protein